MVSRYMCRPGAVLSFCDVFSGISFALSAKDISELFLNSFERFSPFLVVEIRLVDFTQFLGIADNLIQSEKIALVALQILQRKCTD